MAAEKTYDRKQDGLKQENAWKGYYVILNPSYEAQVQWRFINRAINEVEWGFCPGVLLVCRNATDTSYFQRLVPFPRVFLRRDAIRFKDYDNTPIGFGIAVFCLVSPTIPKARKMEMYARFYEEFNHAGEFNLPFDRTFLSTPQFKELTDRLHVVAAKKYRDSWQGRDQSHSCIQFARPAEAPLNRVGRTILVHVVYSLRSNAGWRERGRKHWFRR